MEVKCPESGIVSNLCIQIGLFSLKIRKSLLQNQEELVDLLYVSPLEGAILSKEENSIPLTTAGFEPTIDLWLHQQPTKFFIATPVIIA